MRNRIVACKNSLTKLYCKFEEEEKRDIHKYFRIIYFIYGKKDINISLLDKYIYMYIYTSPRGIVSFDFRSWISLSASKPNVSTSKSVQPFIQQTREKEEKEKKSHENSRLGWPRFIERERKGKKERERKNNKFLSPLSLSIERKWIWFKTSIYIVPGWSINRTRNSWREEKSLSIISIISKCVGRELHRESSCLFFRPINRFHDRDTS